MSEQPKKKVRIIEPTIKTDLKASGVYKQKRVVAYCRVSTKQEEQMNSYETQKNHYTEKINAEPGWALVGIFADKGITGTSVKHRDEFNKMIKLCKRGKVDMIITKSISRFARNTLDCLQYTRMLKKIGVDVFFEEQGIHSLQSGAEFYITIYGSIAQSESENISANVKFGKAQSAREGNVAFHYKNFLGYRKGKDGKPEIVPEEADTVRFIYKSFLAGDSLGGILDKLEKERKPSPSGKEKWSYSTIQSILTNEKYVGDAIINKTYTEDCLSKRIKKNNGERRKYYIENNHPAIIEREVFAKVQEEIARRSSKQKTKQVGTKTEQGKYSSKYAFTELLICGECKTPYRRCTWTSQGRKRIVWRCINRLDYGKKYCHDSPTIEEGVLKESVMNAIFDAAEKNVDLLKELRRHIGMGLNSDASDDDELKIVIRISEIDTEFSQMLNAVTEDTSDSFDEERAKILMGEKANLQRQLDRIAEGKRKQTETEARLNDIYSIMESLKNHPIRYDDSLIRQIVECIIVESKERIKVIFIGGTEVVANIG